MKAIWSLLAFAAVAAGASVATYIVTSQIQQKKLRARSGDAVLVENVEDILDPRGTHTSSTTSYDSEVSVFSEPDAPSAL